MDNLTKTWMTLKNLEILKKLNYSDNTVYYFN